MRELHLKMSMSLDGFVAGPKGELDWMFRHRHPAGAQWVAETIWNASLHIMGSRTYRDMLDWWPYSQEIFAAPMNSIPKAVFTQHGAASVRQGGVTQAIADATKARDAMGDKFKEADPGVLRGWTEAYVAEGPMADEIAGMKRGEGKPIMAHGGAGFARSLVATRLVDQFNMVVYPVVLGEGLPIFTKLDTPLPLKLVDSTVFPNGVAAQVYRPE